MKVQVNGEQREVADGLSVAALVEHLGLNAGRLAIELNLDILPKQQWTETKLHEGDRLEIVHFVGGGESFQISDF